VDDRNKTNSALSSGIVIAAVDVDSGSMAQYEAAIKQGRRVLIPGEDVGAEPYAGGRDATGGKCYDCQLGR